MAANIEQIFQDFILNKIREIEDQNEDKAYVVCLYSSIETLFEISVNRHVSRPLQLPVATPDAK